jgi:hypothetical protein
VRNLVAFAALAVLLFASVALAEKFEIGVEPESSYRSDMDLTLSLPIHNGSVWTSGSAIDGSDRHWLIPDGGVDKQYFIHFIMWKANTTDHGNFIDILKPRFEKLVRDTYPNLELGTVQMAGEPRIAMTLGKTMQLSQADFRVYQMVKELNSEGVEEVKPKVPYWGRLYSLYDSKTQRCLLFLGTANDTAYSTVFDTVYKQFVTMIRFGKVSNAGLVILLVIGVLILAGLGGGYFFLEQKKAADRKRRLREVQDDKYDYYEDDDDYDDYNDRKGGRRGAKSAPPARPTRGGRDTAPSRSPRRR